VLTDTSSTKILAQAGKKVSIWEARPFQLVSLLEMLRFYADFFVEVVGNLYRIIGKIELIPQVFDNELPADTLRDVHFFLDKLLQECQKSNLEVSSNFTDGAKLRLSPETGPITGRMVKEELQGLLNCVNAELSAVLFMRISSDEAKYYKQVNPFGERVVHNFNSAATDIEEASKCLAMGRNTAVVFHLMRVMEIALKVVAKELGIPDPVKAYDRNWGGIISSIKKAIDDKNKAASSDPLWQQDKPFYDNVLADIGAIKTAWRDKTMHVGTFYDSERALHIFTVVQGFMMHLVDKLDE
jgi:hypothetical protein